MKAQRIYTSLITIILSIMSFSCSERDNSNPQVSEAAGVIQQGITWIC